MVLDPLINLIDQYDTHSGNGIAEEVETLCLDEGFALSLESLMIHDSAHNEADYFDTLDLYLDWEGMKKVYDDLHRDCSTAINSILCKQPLLSPVKPQAVPLIETEHADRVLSAIDNINTVDPYLADSLTDLLYSGKIVFVDDFADLPAFVDPRNGTIVIYKSLFSEDAYRSQPSTDGCPGIAEEWSKRLIDSLSESQKRKLVKFLISLDKITSPHFSGSQQGLTMMREARCSGKGYTLYVEEVLSHEVYHSFQLGKLLNISDTDQKAQAEIRNAGLTYATLVYLDLVSRALDQNGYLANVGAFAALTQEEYDANSGELTPLVNAAHYFTEEKAQDFAGQIIRNISDIQKK